MEMAALILPSPHIPHRRGLVFDLDTSGAVADKATENSIMSKSLTHLGFSVVLKSRLDVIVWRNHLAGGYITTARDFIDALAKLVPNELTGDCFQEDSDIHLQILSPKFAFLATIFEDGDLYLYFRLGDPRVANKASSVSESSMLVSASEVELMKENGFDLSKLLAKDPILKLALQANRAPTA